MTKSSSAFEKRIKRHIIAKEKEYFAITAPHTESFALKELTKLKLPINEITEKTGGVYFDGKLDGCYLSNLSLRLASRILMRLLTFKATNFRQTDKILAEFPFELYLFSNATLHFHTTTKQSRLYHSDAISENFKKSIQKRLAKNGVPENKSHAQNLFIRILNDQVTLSLDSSGELLHKRGVKTHPAKAPIRETMASLALTLLKYDSNMPLIDPMCGSGTFSLEAAMVAKNIPPGWFRTFSFMHWPAFRAPHWNYLKKAYGEDIKQLKRAVIFASDQDPESCRQLKESVDKNGLNDAVSVQQSDFFDLQPPKNIKKKGVILINPPYGLRLGTKKESAMLYRDIINKLKSDFSGWNVAMITPKHYDELAVLKKKKVQPLFHGGLNLHFVVGII